MSLNYFHETIKKKGEEIGITYFSSPNNMIDVVENGYDNGWDNNGHSDGTKRFDSQYSSALPWRWGEQYVHDIKKSKEMIRSGDISTNHFNKMNKLLAAVKRTPEYNRIAKASQKTRKRMYGEEGDELDIERLMCGDPEHWSKITKSGERPLYKICINGSANAGREGDYFFKIAAAAFILTTFKQQENKAVEIDLLFKAANSTHDLDYSYNFINLKNANESIDIKKICIPVIQSILRVYDFAVTCNISKGTPSSGLGQPRKYENELENYQYDLIINADDFESDEESIIKYVRDKLK